MPKIRLTYEYEIPKEQDDWTTSKLAYEAVADLVRKMDFNRTPSLFSKIERIGGIWVTDVQRIKKLCG